MMEVGEYYMVGFEVIRLEGTSLGSESFWRARDASDHPWLVSESVLTNRVTGFDGTPYEEPAFQGKVGEYWEMTQYPWTGTIACLDHLDETHDDPAWHGWHGRLVGCDWAFFTFDHLKGAIRVQGFSGEPYVGDVQDDGPRDMTLAEFAGHLLRKSKNETETPVVRKPQVGDVYLVPSTGDTMTVCQSTEKSIRLHGPDSDRFGRYRYVFRPSHFENHLTDGLFVLADRSQLIRDKLAELDAKRAREQATHWDPYGGLL